MSVSEANRLIVEAAKVVESNHPGWTFPVEVSRKLNCSWVEAYLALELALSMHAPIAKRYDGRWYYDFVKASKS